LQPPETRPRPSRSQQWLSRTATDRRSIGGHASAPFTLRTLPAAAVKGTFARDEIVAASRERHGRPIAEIDAALELALGKSSVSEKPFADEVVRS
jgi:hypothetical protein